MATVNDNMLMMQALLSGDNLKNLQYGSAVQQLGNGQYLAPQQSASDQAIANNKVRESNAKANKAELDAIQTAQTVDPNFFKRTVGFDMPDIGSGSSVDTYAAMQDAIFNAPDSVFNQPNDPWSQAIKSQSQEPTPEQTQEQPATEAATTDASTDPAGNSTEPVSTETNTDTVIPAGNAPTTTTPQPSTALTDAGTNSIEALAQHANESRRRNTRWDRLAEFFHIKPREEFFNDLSNTGVTYDGKPFTRGPKGTTYLDPNSKEGKEIVNQFKRELANLNGTPLNTATNSANSTSTTVTDPSQQGAVQAAGSAVNVQQAQGQETALTKNAPPEEKSSNYVPTMEETEGIRNIMAKAAAGEVGKSDLEKLGYSINSITDNLYEGLNRQAVLIGGMSNLEYTLENAKAGAEKVAGDMVNTYGLDKKYIPDVTRTISIINAKYPNLTPAVIASVIRTSSRNDTNWWIKPDSGRDTDIGQSGLEYMDAEVASKLSVLNNKSSSGSYEAIKDGYKRARSAVAGLSEVETAMQMSLQQYNKHLRDRTAWGEDPKNQQRADWLREDKDKTNQYAYIAGQKALAAFGDIGSMYNAQDRITYADAKKAKASAAKAEPASEIPERTALEKASGYGIYTN